MTRLIGTAWLAAVVLWSALSTSSLAGPAATIGRGVWSNAEAQVGPQSSQAASPTSDAPLAQQSFLEQLTDTFSKNRLVIALGSFVTLAAAAIWFWERIKARAKKLWARIVKGKGPRVPTETLRIVPDPS